MKKIAIALVLLTSCSGGGDQQGGNQAAPAGSGAGAAGGELTMTGLFEGGPVDPKNQLCMVPGEGDGGRFGLVVWGANMHSCSGSGTATRSGNTLRLAMAGDEVCSIDARISGSTIALPAAIPDGCAYYCGAGATMQNVTFAQVGTTREDAAKARDLVGEPLCGGRN